MIRHLRHSLAKVSVATYKVIRCKNKMCKQLKIMSLKIFKITVRAETSDYCGLNM